MPGHLVTLRDLGLNSDGRDAVRLHERWRDAQNLAWVVAGMNRDGGDQAFWLFGSEQTNGNGEGVAALDRDAEDCPIFTAPSASQVKRFAGNLRPGDSNTGIGLQGQPAKLPLIQRGGGGVDSDGRGRILGLKRRGFDAPERDAARRGECGLRKNQM
jgi:hypothetical protein